MSWWSGAEEPPDSLGDQFDESDVRIRPARGGSKPRTKVRPQFTDAVAGMVVAVDRGRYRVLVDDVSVTASRARELNKQAIVTGDRVDLVGDTTGEPGTLARIVRIQPRATVLRRSADDSDSVERVIVANADQLLIVIASANPEPRVRLVDRYLVAAFDAGITPMICVTKCDLADPTEFLANFDGLDIPVFTSSRDDMPLGELREQLVNHLTVLVGHSGVGKSTLVNALVPGTDRATGEVNEVTGRGRHTSSSTVCLLLETPLGSGWIVDTPGVRSFGLGHVNPHNILGSFPDLATVAETCPRGCTHLRSAPDCELNESLKNGALGANGQTRVDSLQRLLATFADKTAY